MVVLQPTSLNPASDKKGIPRSLLKTINARRDPSSGQRPGQSSLQVAPPFSFSPAVIRWFALRTWDLQELKKFALILCTSGIIGLIFPLRSPAQQDSPPQQGSASSASAADTRNEDQNAKKQAKPDAPTAKTVVFDPPDPLLGYGVITLAKDVVSDQKRILTSPSRLRLPDIDWLVPLSGISAGLFVTDRDVSTHISADPSSISHYKRISDGGIVALAGGAAGLWLLSYPSHNEHWREAGFLSGEAALNSLIEVEALKYTLRRERPFQSDGSGPFFSGGSSFPSEHAAAAWSIAGVLAHEYPGIFPKLAVYSLASLVSYSRIRGRQHFPSDVFIGGVMGQFIAQDIYSQHHDPELGGDTWRSIGQVVRGDANLSSPNQASPYVPIDSWIYPALERLMALGAIDSAFASIRPWTRRECARMFGEAESYLGDSASEDSEVGRIYQLLANEFHDELEDANGSNRHFKVESIYARATGISGPSLGQGLNYDFGQTIINDYGRPYEEGVNGIAGFSAWATSGRWVAYVRGEYEHAPSAPALPEPVLLAIPVLQGLPGTPPATPFAAVNRFQLLDAYAGMNLNNWQFTFGQQSLWWSPTEGGGTLYSNNAVSIPMFRVNRVSPLPLPWIFGLLGPVRVELFFGQMTGHNFVASSQTTGGPVSFIGSYTQTLNPQPQLLQQCKCATWYAWRPWRSAFGPRLGISRAKTSRLGVILRGMHSPTINFRRSRIGIARLSVRDCTSPTFRKYRSSIFARRACFRIRPRAAI